MIWQAVKILEHLAKDRFVIECAFCSGEGIMNGFEAHVPCRICQGEGHLTIRGRAPLSVCDRCKGLGYAPEAEWYVVCPSCRGSGAKGQDGGSVQIID